MGIEIVESIEGANVHPVFRQGTKLPQQARPVFAHHCPSPVDGLWAAKDATADQVLRLNILLHETGSLSG